MSLQVRTISDDEVPAWCAALSTGFLNPTGDIDAEVRRPGLVLNRTWAGFDGNRMVSTLRSWPSELTMPGGQQVSTSAISAVSTMSTHRRRGQATALVTADLAASKERGETAAMLIAAESKIYGRFGFGPATESQNWTVNARAAQFRTRPAGSIELVDLESARAQAPELYDQHRAQRPGEMLRPERFWDLDFGIVRMPSWPEPKKSFYALARDPDGTPTGIARYSVEHQWINGQPSGTLTLSMLFYTNPQAEALLWQHLIELDWVALIETDNCAVDGILPWLLTDERDAVAKDRSDFLWVRPLNTAAFLSARSYGVVGRIVLEVVDPIGLAGGRFALDSGSGEAECLSTNESADLTLSMSALASVSLGGYRPRALAAAGLIAEEKPGAVALADAMFFSPVTPWCSTMF